MKKITKYICDVCGTGWDRRKDAIKCEGREIKGLNIKVGEEVEYENWFIWGKFMKVYKVGITYNCLSKEHIEYVEGFDLETTESTGKLCSETKHFPRYRRKICS